MTVGSLFAGIGGIDIAFRQAGFDIKWVIEKDAACCITYRNNFDGTDLLECDIHNVDLKSLPKVDIITAGFPCQSFSVAGKQRGFSDPRGGAFFEIQRFIMWSNPRFVFLENVPNLIDRDDGKTFNAIHNTLSELGYVIRYKALRTSKYRGVPQIRDRICMVAFREQAECDGFKFPNPIGLEITIEDILKQNVKKHNVYYYGTDNSFYKHVKQFVKRKDSIYRVYHDSISLLSSIFLLHSLQNLSKLSI